MTRKHYEAIAEQFRYVRPATRPKFHNDNKVVHDTLDVLATNLAYEFASDNPRFDRKRFLTACGVIS